MKYKIIIIAAFLVVSCVLAFYICMDNIVIAMAQRQLKSICAGSVVTIGRCRVKPATSIVLTDVEIKVPATYDIKIKDLKISYSISSLMRGDILKSYLGDSSFNINMGDKDITQLKGYFNLGSGKGALKVNEAQVSALALTLKARDVNFSGKISLALDLKEDRIKNIDLKLDSLDAKGILLENGYLKSQLTEESAEFYVQSVKYNGVKMNDVSGSVFIDDNTVSLRSFSAKIFSGTVNANMSYRIDKNRDFTIDLNAAGLDLSAFVSEMKLENKFQMTGRLNGKAVLSGNGLIPSEITGDFSTDPAGGVLVIKDTRFLENMAKDSGQSLDILMESFKQYQYNIGLMKLSVDSGTLIMDVALEGASGKRNFNVILHDFLPKKGRGL